MKFPYLSFDKMTNDQRSQQLQMFNARRKDTALGGYKSLNLFSLVVEFLIRI